MTTLLDKTESQLRLLGMPIIGVQLQDGSKLFGRLTRFTHRKIYFRDKSGDEIDVPRQIIVRAMLLIEGGKSDGGSTAVCAAHQSKGG